MIFSTTPTLEGHPIREYRGVVTGETIIGANVFKDFMAGLRDFFGGRSGTYESVLREAKDSAMREMAQRAESLGCNAIVGIDLDYETVGQGRIDAHGDMQRHSGDRIKAKNTAGRWLSKAGK